MQHHGMLPTGSMDIELDLLIASRVKAFSRKPMNQARPYPDLHAWMAAVFSVTRVVGSAIHHLQPLRAGYIELNPRPTCSGSSKSVCCDTTHIPCTTCQRHYHRTYCRLTRSQKGIQGFVCFFCSGDVAALPSTATVTSNNVLPRRCLLRHRKIRHGIRPIMCQQSFHLAHRKCSGISRYMDKLSWLCPACSLPTTSIPTQPMMGTTNNTHAPTVLPPTTNMNCLSPHHTLINPPLHHRLCSSCLRETSAPFIYQPEMPSMLQSAG